VQFHNNDNSPIQFGVDCDELVVFGINDEREGKWE